MSKDKAGPTINQGSASTPTRTEREREFAGIAGKAGEKGETPSPSARERGETSTADESASAALDTAHDRAS